MPEYEIVNTITINASDDDYVVHVLRSVRYKIFSIFWSKRMTSGVKMRTEIKNCESGNIIKVFE